MIHIPLWLAALLGLVSLTLAAGALMVFAWQLKTKSKSPRMPDEWALTGRAVFSTSERRLFRLLRETLPAHIILAKLPMVRFCQPIDFGRTRYWYDLLGSNYVSFAICAPNGRVLAAIDIDKDRQSEENVQLRRSMKIKRAVLRSCRIRYLRVPAGAGLTESEIKLLLAPVRDFFDDNPLAAPQADTSRDDAVQTPEGHTPTLVAETTARLVRARESLASTVASRRAQRKNLWADSSMFQDSFFALDSRLDDSALSPGVTEPARQPAESTTAAPETPSASDRTRPSGTASPEVPSTASVSIGPDDVDLDSTAQADGHTPRGRQGKKSRSARHARRQPPVVNVTLDDALPEDHLSKVVQLNSEQARNVAGQG